MLKRLTLRSFKSWPEADVEFGQITRLFGTNLSGKSSLGQFLLLLKQTQESNDLAATLDLNARFVQLGAASDLIHGGDEQRRIDFELRFDSEPSAAVGWPKTLPRSKDLAIDGELELHRCAFRSRRLAYRVGEAEFTLRRTEDGGTGFELVADTPGRFKFTRARGRPPKPSGPVKTYRFPDSARTGCHNSDFLSSLELAFERQLDRLHYLGPLREHPQRDYLWAGSRPDDVGDMGEWTIAAIIAAQTADEKQNLGRNKRHRPFSHIVAHWLHELGLIDSFRVEEIAAGSNRWQAMVQTARGGAEVTLTDVGFGVSQVLPVIVLLDYVPEGSTVLLEQPEIHLHPLAQSGLADMIVHAATHRKVQIVLASYSEHLLLRLQRRIAEERINAGDVALHFCRMDDRASRIEALELDPLGNTAIGPTGSCAMPSARPRKPSSRACSAGRTPSNEALGH